MSLENESSEKPKMSPPEMSPDDGIPDDGIPEESSAEVGPKIEETSDELRDGNGEHPHSPALATTRSVGENNDSETSTILDVESLKRGRSETEYLEAKRAKSDTPEAEEKQDPQEEENDRKVYVSNLAYRTTAKELEEFFEQWGTVENVCVPQHPVLQRSRGFAFVTFQSKEASETAIAELNGREYDGRTLYVSRPNELYTRDTECKFYKSPTGCFNGANCRFAHTGEGKIADGVPPWKTGLLHPPRPRVPRPPRGPPTQEQSEFRRRSEAALARNYLQHQHIYPPFVAPALPPQPHLVYPQYHAAAYQVPYPYTAYPAPGYPSGGTSWVGGAPRAYHPGPPPPTSGAYPPGTYRR